MRRHCRYDHNVGSTFGPRRRMAEPSNPGSGPFAAGTTYDTIAHTVLDPAGSQLGRTFVLENRPGGGGTAALASVVKPRRTVKQCCSLRQQ